MPVGHALNDGSHGPGSVKAGIKEGQGEQAVVIYGARLGAVDVWRGIGRFGRIDSTPMR